MEEYIFKYEEIEDSDIIEDEFFKECYVLYDEFDNLICYYDTFTEFLSKFNYKSYEIYRKFRNSESNYISLELDKKKYKLYLFS